MGFYYLGGYTHTCSMPTAEYKVYISNSTLVAEIESLLDDRDQSASEFFREAARRELQREVDA